MTVAGSLIHRQHKFITEKLSAALRENQLNNSVRLIQGLGAGAGDGAGSV